jgi:hypothetical protein
MTIALAGKPQKTPKWQNWTKIKDRITRVLQTIKTEIVNVMTPTKDHLHHTIVTTITTNDLAMIVDYHHHKVAPTSKCAVCAAQATTTKTIIDKAHHYMIGKKDTKNKHKINS